MAQDNIERIRVICEDVKNRMYTSLVIRGNKLYERVYCTYDKPDYEMLRQV
jgi:hypothetical protein